MDRFDHLSAFVAVAEHKGFAAAARQLALSASAVTRQVAALEEHLGIGLFQRTTRSVTLTDAGQRYLERARRILSDLKEADDNAQAERGMPAGRLVVAAPSLFGRMHISPLLCQFLTRYTAVMGELLLADRLVNLVEEGVDVALRIGHLADSSLVTRKLGETRRVVVGSPTYLKRQGAPGALEALAHHDLIHFTALGEGQTWRFHHKGRELRVPISPRYVTNSADAAIWHAEHDGGLTMVLAYQVDAALKAGRLKIVLPTFEPPPLPIQLVYPTSRLLSAKVRAFIDLASELSDWRFI